jgi:transposase
LVDGLLQQTLLKERIERLRTIPGVGEILALTWALEIGDVHRFGNVGQAQSYCGLTSAQVSSGGQDYRAPLSKMCNQHLQTVLIEAAKLAPPWNETLKAVYERERARANAHRATLAVARKRVAYLLAVDRSGRAFQVQNRDGQPAG